MIQIDLITGFLGSGKTTFIRRYADWLLRSGKKLGILENDYGAVNVDVMLLQELEAQGVGVESVAGACDEDCHRRRFKTKLIALGMSGYDRVLIEPSGVFDMDEFFDALCESPLDRWYQIGSVIAVVDAQLEDSLSENSEYMLASQVANAGTVVLSKTQLASQKQIAATVAHLNRAMERFGCQRRFGGDVLAKPWDELTDADFERIAAAGYHAESYVKFLTTHDGAYQSLYFLNHRFTAVQLRALTERLFADKNCGDIFRVKGFTDDGGWLELNATKQTVTIDPVANGQEIIIVIGENLNEEAIRKIVGEGFAKPITDN